MITKDLIVTYSKKCYICSEKVSKLRVFYSISLEQCWSYSETRPVNNDGRRCKIFLCKPCFIDQAGNNFRFDIDILSDPE